jgi:hypothetical protein
MKILFVVLLFSLSSVWAGRPDMAFSFKENTCVCRNDKAVSKGDCANVCRGKNTKGADVLFADFSVSSVLANSSLKNVKNWCYKYIFGDLSFPKCVVEVTDADGNKSQLSSFSFPGNNSLSVDVSSLDDDQNYWFRLVETSSGANSIPYELYIFDPIGYPLKTSNLSQYSCYPREAKDLRVNFYFGPHAPSALKGNETIVCHDAAKYGEHDGANIPRLGLLSPVASLWNSNNSLFFDSNGDGVLDINEVVVKMVEENGGEIKKNLRLFGVLSGPGTKEQNLEAGNAEYDRLGFLMSYWVDTKTFHSFCPSEKDYASGAPLYKAMKSILSKGTEGIYLADRSESEVRSHLFIRESDLRAVWFYNNNGVPTRPSEDQVQFQTIYFYHPLNKENPLEKQPHQKMFRVRAASEITTTMTTLQAFTPNTGEMISYPSHDRKLGCIPKF